MANETPIYKLPYPESADIPDIAGDIQKLAQATDAMVGKLITGTWGQGEMAGFPAAQEATSGIPIYQDDLHRLWAQPFVTKRHSTDPMGSYTANLYKKGTAAAPFWYQWGPLVFLSLQIVRLGSILNANADSNITNHAIGNLASDVPRPLGNVHAANAISGPIAGLYLSATGTVSIASIGTGGHWAINEEWNETFFYMTADKVSI